MRGRVFLLAAVAAVAALAGACGPRPAPTPIPLLPGEGDANVAKPPTAAKPAASDPWAGRTDLIVPPPPAPPAPVEIPTIASFDLPNGLKVFAIKNDRLPVVSLQLAVRAGRMHEPRARLGIAEITADMLVKGSARRDAAALAKAIDFVGGTIAVNATFEATLVSCSVLRRHLGTCLELVPEMLTQPTFREPELAKVREVMIGQIRNRLDDAGTLASQHAQNLLWGEDHVRGWTTTEPAIAGIRREDLVAWHKTWFVPNNAMLVVAGDVDPVRLKADLLRAFGGWRRAPVPPVPSYREPGLSGSRIRLVDKPGQAQAHLRIAQFGIKHEDPRFFDTLVWNHVLGGGGPDSRMMRAARAGGGRLYGASSSFDRNLDKGSFVVQALARGGQAVGAGKLLLGELARMGKDGPTQEEVSAAVATIAGGYGLRFQSVADVGAALVGAELHGFGREYLANFPIAVGQVDAASAKRAAAELLDPKAYVLVLVGDAKDLEPQLKQEGWRYEKVPFTRPITPRVAAPEVPIDPKLAAAARKVVDEALAAKGGKARLAAVKGFRMLATGTTTTPPRGTAVPVEIERVLVVPDKLRIDATLDGKVKVTIAVNGRTGWQIAPDQTGQGMALTEFAPAEIAQIELELWREPELILLKAAEPGAKISLAPDETLDGKPHAVVKLRTPFGGLDISMFIDRKTKLVSKLTYTEGRTTQTDTFGDYKDVRGLQIAHQRHSTGGRETKLELKRVELDPKVDPKLFDKPAAAPGPAPAPPKAAPKP